MGIRSLKRDFPDVLFLSEAYPSEGHYRLAKLASASRTHTPLAQHEYGTEEYSRVGRSRRCASFFRASQWPNTPDILTAFLQTGSARFMIRTLLAATLGANYGVIGPAF